VCAHDEMRGRGYAHGPGARRRRGGAGRGGIPGRRRRGGAGRGGGASREGGARLEVAVLRQPAGISNALYFNGVFNNDYL
jgi:hypothetical protein